MGGLVRCIITFVLRHRRGVCTAVTLQGSTSATVSTPAGLLYMPSILQSLVHLDSFVAHTLALLQGVDVFFLGELPRLHDLLVFLHSGQVAREAQLLGSFAAVVDEVVVEGVEFEVACVEVVGQDFAIGLVGFDVRLHAAEVFVGGCLVDFERRRRGVRHIWVLELLSGIGLDRVRIGGLRVERQCVFHATQSKTAILLRKQRFCEVSYIIQTKTGRLRRGGR